MRKTINTSPCILAIYACVYACIYAFIYVLIFEKLVFDAIFEFMIENNILNSTQSGFKPNDSFVNQLILINNSIFSAFDTNPSSEVCGVFLELVTLQTHHVDSTLKRRGNGKLMTSGINGNLFDLSESFLQKRNQRVALNRQYFD